MSDEKKLEAGNEKLEDGKKALVTNERQPKGGGERQQGQNDKGEGEQGLFDLPAIDYMNQDEFILAAEVIIEQAGENMQKRMDGINKICQMLLEVRDPLMEDQYIDRLSKLFKGISKKSIRDKFKQMQKQTLVIDEELGVKLSKAEKEQFKKFGFWKDKNAYWFMTNTGGMKASNFIIEPLYHIYSKQDNKRLIKIINEFGYDKIVDIPSKCFPSVDQFQQVIYGEGNYIFFGQKVHFMKILNEISGKFPLCEELKTLGWQREGFWAFANGTIDKEGWKPVDEMGIAKHKKSMYFSPAFSSIYKDVREDDDEYESDRYFIYQKSPVDFSGWSRQMLKVYGENSIIAISFVIASLFRDLIYEKYKIFPHLFLFGEKASGKSQLGWSLSNVFLNGQPPYNLNSGTNVGFIRKLARFKNVVQWFDEFTPAIDPKRFQALKAAYDGVGYEKGKMTNDNKTAVTKVNASCVISGQYLPTPDDNALFVRSILLSFSRKIYNNEEIAEYNKLKKYEEQGISSIIEEIICYRDIVDRKYAEVFSYLFDQMKDEMMEDNQQFEERLLRNFVTILAPLKIVLEFNQKLDVGFTFQEAYDLSKKMLNELSKQISSSESLSMFWNLIEYMLDSKLIAEGVDFKIEKLDKLTLRDKRDEPKEQKLSPPEDVLLIRFSKIHPLYMESHRKQHGMNGVDMVSLLHYIKNHAAYLGHVNAWRFNNSVSSCYAFRYNILKINLSRGEEQTEPLPF
jgi:hypothetical protein